MNNYTLTEVDWKSFIQTNIISLCVPASKAKVFALVGELGAGKTTFSKELLHQLGVIQHIQSPTFSIINSYDISFGAFKKVFHVDVYRIEDLKELEVLHFTDMFENPENIVVLEWADKVKDLIPQDAEWIYFEHDTNETRKVLIQHGKN